MSRRVPNGLSRLFVFLGSERIGFCERWRKVRIIATGEVLHVGVVRGNAVRIPYKPRGANRGYKWSAVVNDEKGRRVYSGACFKSSGVAGTLWYAGLLDVPLFRWRSREWFQRTPQCPNEDGAS